MKTIRIQTGAKRAATAALFLLLLPWAGVQGSLAHFSNAERLERIFAYARQYRERMPSFEVDALIAS